jgi:hypothetical protein
MTSTPHGAAPRGVSRSRVAEFDPNPADQISLRRSIIMSASLHPTQIHRRQHRKAKRDKLRAQLAAAPAAGRAAIEARLQKTYAVGSAPQASKSNAHDAAPVPAKL